MARRCFINFKKKGVLSGNMYSKKIPSPYFITLTKDACLKAFWRKSTLRTFLLQQKVSQNYLNSWSDDESKRMYIDRLFEALIKTPAGRGYKVIFNIAESIAEMKSFPDLENWEDSADKKSKAHEAVSRLRMEVNKLKKSEKDEKEVEEKRKKYHEEQQQKIATASSIEKLQQSLTDLVSKQGTQEGGHAFEKWFYDLVDFFELHYKKSYKDRNDRQIDGSITLDGTTFLVETKFTKDPTGSQDIDIFFSKIQRKADNTMGIMLSMAGFNDNAIENACRDRTTLLLMDYTHLYNLIFPQLMTLQEVIQRIWRHASQTGESYLAVKDFSR